MKQLKSTKLSVMFVCDQYCDYNFRGVRCYIIENETSHKIKIRLYNTEPFDDDSHIMDGKGVIFDEHDPITGTEFLFSRCWVWPRYNHT